MRRLLSVLVLACGVGLSATAQEVDAAVRAVFSQQIEAFRADDFETAFGFASPGIRRMFRTPDRFGEMVRDGYPMVWRPADVKFSGLEARGGRMVQDVLITDQSGRLHVLEYELIRVDGAWKINGVRIREPRAVGA